MLEGIDGAGKSEQTARLGAWLRASGWRVVETREPTDGEWGRRYRAWARGQIEAGPEEVLRFFIEDRREHVASRIAPALAGSSLVICDRYVASTRVYQAAHGIDPELLRRTLDAERSPEPDLVLWLRLPVERALERLGPAATERYERAEFLRRVDLEYAKLGLVEVDASPDVEQVAAALFQQVSALLQSG